MKTLTTLAFLAVMAVGISGEANASLLTKENKTSTSTLVHLAHVERQ